jgi:hypothetical protein
MEPVTLKEVPMREDPAITRVLALVALIMALSAALAYSRPGTAGHAASASTLVIRGFEATVYQGPDKGLSLVGTLTMQAEEKDCVTCDTRRCRPKTTEPAPTVRVAADEPPRTAWDARCGSGLLGQEAQAV